MIPVLVVQAENSNFATVSSISCKDDPGLFPAHPPQGVEALPFRAFKDPGGWVLPEISLRWPGLSCSEILMREWRET